MMRSFKNHPLVRFAVAVLEIITVMALLSLGFL